MTYNVCNNLYHPCLNTIRNASSGRVWATKVDFNWCLVIFETERIHLLVFTKNMDMGSACQSFFFSIHFRTENCNAHILFYNDVRKKTHLNVFERILERELNIALYLRLKSVT